MTVIIVHVHIYVDVLRSRNTNKRARLLHVNPLGARGPARASRACVIINFCDASNGDFDIHDLVSFPDRVETQGGVTPIGTVYRDATGVKIFDRRKMALTA